MAKGGLSKRTTYNKGGGHRTTITQNTKNGTTHSYSDGGDHSRTTISHKPNGRIVRTITERHGGGYTSRTTKTISGKSLPKNKRKETYQRSNYRTKQNSYGNEGLIDLIIGCLFLVKWLVTKKWFWIGLGAYLLYAGIVNVLQANIGY